MTPNQDQNYQAEKNKNAMEYAGLDETDIKCDLNKTCFFEKDAYISGANFATFYWSKRMVPGEIHNKRLEELGEYITKYEESKKVVEKLAAQLKECLKVCARTDGLDMRDVNKALAAWDEFSEKRQALADFEKARGGE